VLLNTVTSQAINGVAKRSERIGQRLGDFDLTIKLSRNGNQHEAVAAVHDDAGDFTCRSRRRDWREAIRDLIQRLVAMLHGQHIARRRLA